MSEAPRQGIRAIRRPMWLAALLCLFLATSSGLAEAHGLIMLATDQPDVSAAATATDHDSCPDDGLRHDHHRCCAGQGLCHAAALVQDVIVAAATERQRLAPIALAARAGSDVAPLFHPPKSQPRS